MNPLAGVLTLSPRRKLLDVSVLRLDERDPSTAFSFTSWTKTSLRMTAFFSLNHPLNLFQDRGEEAVAGVDAGDCTQVGAAG